MPYVPERKGMRSLMRKYLENSFMNKINREILVVGRNYANILTMVRDLGEAGYKSNVLRIQRKKRNFLNILTTMNPEAYSKYTIKYMECIATDDMKIINSLLEIVQTNDKTLLIPVDDYTASIIDKHYDILSERYIMPSINQCQGEICKLMDKNKQKELAFKHGLPLLGSVLIKTENSRYEIPEDIAYPCFIKPNMSMNSTKAVMRKCQNESELKAVLDKYAEKGDFEILAEEFVEIESEYSILGFSSGEKNCIPGIFKVIEGGHRERKGVSITGKTIDDSRFKVLIDKCGEFVASLNYVGLFDIDLIETTDGKVYFIELNLRGGASIRLFSKAGVNLPGMFADNIVMDKSFDDNKRLEEIGLSFVSEKVLIEEYVRSDIDKNKMKEILESTKVSFILDVEDKHPGKYYERIFKYLGIFRILYKVKG